jgi:hypothetical protein
MRLFPLFLVLSLACSGGDDDTARVDTGTPEADTDADTDADADADADTDTDTDTEPPPPPPVFWELGDPCSGGTPYAISFVNALSGLVGCGSGMGLWSTSDGGDSFTYAFPSANEGRFYVNEIVRDGDDTLVCGHDYSTDPGTFLYRYRDGSWTNLLWYGSNNNDPAWAQLANCGAVASDGDGHLIVASDTSGDITWSDDDGATWSQEFRYWEDDNLRDDGYAYYYMLNLTAVDGFGFAGAGSRIVEPPVFYKQSTLEGADWHTFDAIQIAELQGEVWALGTPDGGHTWFAGGRDQAASSVASGFLFRSTDGGDSWEDVSLGGTVDIMHDIAFDEDGLHGVAVGHRYPPGSLGGFVALTEDGGDTWTLRDEDVPPLYAAGISGETFWVSAEGYLARGIFD